MTQLFPGLARRLLGGCVGGLAARRADNDSGGHLKWHMLPLRLVFAFILWSFTS